MRLDGKTALITGGNSGIGFAAARAFIDAGARIVITGRDEAKLKEAAAALGSAATPVMADSTSQSGLETLADACRSALGTLDAAFLNAGITGPTPLGTTSWDAFETILRTNLTGVFFTAQAILPLMNQGASLVLNGSIMRQLGAPGSAAYSASKGGVTAMAAVLASELAPRGIRVNTVIPGATETPIWTRGHRAGQAIDETTRTIRRSIPMDRLAKPEEVAAAVLFLASPASSGMTAAEIVVDGGSIGAPFGAPAFQR